jgi:hypothetical protein
MSRAPSAEPITVKPMSNIYTVLAAAGFIVALLGFGILLLRGQQLGVPFFSF